MSNETYRSYCPGCEPDVDISREIVSTFWCTNHQPVESGPDDTRIIAGSYLSGSAEVEGDDNRLWCDFFHRGKTRAE